jgi:hypothetical protein
MSNSRFTIINLAIALVLVASPFLIHVTSSQGVYDPWCDQDSDGDIDIFDIVPAAAAFATTGDPTRSVTVMNWPVTNQHTVWYNHDSSATSGWYNASGFGHLHLIWYVSDLVDPESVTVDVRVRIINPAGGFSHWSAESQPVTTVNHGGALSFPVPSETFRFEVNFAPETTARVYLAFYLTYA